MRNDPLVYIIYSAYFLSSGEDFFRGGIEMDNPLSGKTRSGMKALIIRYVSFLLTLLLTCTIFISTAGAKNSKKITSGYYTKATFDLFSMFQTQYVAPSAGATFTLLSVQARNITPSYKTISLQTRCTSPYFTAIVFPCLLAITGRDGKATALVLVSCAPNTPEGTVCYIKVTGKFQGEKHRQWLKVIALSSKPLLQRTSGDPIAGQGYASPEVQPYTGLPLEWCLGATNNGFVEDTFPLSYSADFPCSVRFVNAAGNEISNVKIKGLTRNLLYPTTAQFKAVVNPLVALPKNEQKSITFKLGPGSYTPDISEVTVKVFNPGMLFCMNDLAGPRPHVHQVQTGSKTTFLLHVTNLDSSIADISLFLQNPNPSWKITLDRTLLTELAPAKTAQILVTVEPPVDGIPAERVDFVVRAESSSGRSDSVSLAAEITQRPKVYFWAIDSIDPEYLYLNKAGTGPGSDGDWLMPNTRSFLSDCVNYTNAKCFLPAATDMNHTNALAGTYTGTSGIYLVGGSVKGFNEYDEILQGPNSMQLMRYGSEGKPIERIYEVAKRETEGKALCGLWSNKNWLTELECEQSVDIAGHSEKYPFFFKPPYKYIAGDPTSDSDPSDPLAGPFSMCLYSDLTQELIIPMLLGQYSLILGIGIFIMPVNIFFGMMPGGHCEDAYLVDSFLRSLIEEDPDISYINIADLDNTGHFTGASWTQDEWDTKGTPGASDDESRFSPWMRRDECLDILREADILFGRFINTLKERGVYDGSIIVLLSDHGMENLKDPSKGYELIDIRKILRAHGILYGEDYHENGGAGTSIWVHDPAKAGAIEQILENYEINDPDLGNIRPMIVVNREEMKNGVDLGPFGSIRPMELYSKFWIENPQEGQVWADLFVFPLYNYNIVSHGQILAGGFNPIGISLGNFPDSMQLGFPAAHGGPTTAKIPLLFKAPRGYNRYAPGSEYSGEVTIGDIAPTIYQILGWEEPECVDGSPLPPTAWRTLYEKRNVKQGLIRRSGVGNPRKTRRGFERK